MWIVLFALRYKYTIGVLGILILLFGVMSARKMSTDILPRVDSPEITLVWSYNGLNAAEMASKITSFSEIATMNNVDDLLETRSETSNGVGAGEAEVPALCEHQYRAVPVDRGVTDDHPADAGGDHAAADRADQPLQRADHPDGHLCVR